MSNEYTEPVFNPHVATAIVERIKSNVDKMLAGSNVIEQPWRRKDVSFGVFEMNELKLGKLMGTGAFSDVYEIEGFELSKKASSKHAPHKMATRQFFKGNATNKNEKPKYVVKHLRPTLARTPSSFCMAAADLCIEAQYLNMLTHDNILKIRGWSTGGIDGYGKGHHDGYFLILDRLSETLGDRIETWKKEKRSLDYGLEHLSLENDSTAELLSRTKIVHQVALALEYLHKKNIIFRDLKPNNVGFDENGTVKIFDFGLARELPKECTNVNEVYHMSGKIGTLRYMAPEVALSQSYNQKVDTYSWAMLYWRCLTLERPYGVMARSVHLSLVCRLGQRPQVSDEWPISLQRLLRRAWAPDMYIRATMMEVCAYLERIEKELSSDLGSQVRRTSSLLSRESFSRQRSSSLISMAA